MNEITLTVKES